MADRDTLSRLERAATQDRQVALEAVRQSYEHLAKDELDPFLGKGGASVQMKLAHKSCGLDKMLEVEKRTTG